MNANKCTFAADEQLAQERYFEANLREKAGHLGRKFQLKPEHRFEGLLEPTRQIAPDLFEKLGIQWHSYIGHGRSSQACCLNFLMPFADKPDLLARWVSDLLGIEPPTMVPIEKEVAGSHRFVAFEYTGPNDIDYLGEAEGGTPQRGAHATAADAAVAFVDAANCRHLLLIEWKYSEEYRSHSLTPDAKGKRAERYGNKIIAPNGPIRDNLGLRLEDFLREPFYQLVRQQMLAWQIQHRSQESGFDRARVVHLSPAGNRALHLVTAPALQQLNGVEYTDAFEAYQACLVDPASFIGCTIEDAFAPLSEWPEADWYPQLAERYSSFVTPRG